MSGLGPAGGTGADGADSRVVEVQRLIAEQPSAGLRAGMVGELRRLCGAATQALPASGAGVSLMTTAGGRGVAASSGADYAVIEELQFSLGEGPCIDAYASGRPVLEPDLLAAADRWPGYTHAVHARGVRAVFAFPLMTGSGSLGVLDVFRTTTGGLSADALAQAATFAEVATTTLLDGQSEASPGHTDDGLDAALDNHYEVYQAQGMVSVQLGVGLDEAMARLRAHAFAEERRLGDVARDVLARRLTFDPDET